MAKPKQKQNKADGLIPSEYTLAEIFAPRTDMERLRDRLCEIAQKQIKTSVDYKRGRMEEVQKSIDLYNGRTKKALKGRWNVPLPLMSGYIDTLLSKTDDPPTIKFGHQDLADLQRSQKVQAKYQQDSSDVAGMWASKDRMGKKLAGFYGVCIYKYYAWNDEKGMYRSNFEVVDPLDFECEPMGGQILRNHKFKSQRNIFKTESELKAGATGETPVYDKLQVLRLISTYASTESKDFDKLYAEKTERLKALGFSPENHSYVGIKVHNLTEHYMEYEGVWYYLLLEPHSGIAVRFALLKDVFESGEDPFEAWHTHPDPFNFWSKAPADDMRPIAEGVNVIFNQALDNREKKNYVQRAYDPAVFPDPSQLTWSPDGLVEVEAGISAARSISSGIYDFKVEDMPEAGTLNLMKFMDDLTGVKTGVTPAAQGQADEKTNGIYFGNLQQVSDRLGLYNKAYSECWGRVGRKYYFGLRQCVKGNKMMVKMIGPAGYNWVELVKEDTEPLRDFNIEIVGGQAQARMDEVKKKGRIDSLVVASKLMRINPDVATEEILRNGEWEDGQIKRLMDMQSYGSEQIVSEAHQAIEDILLGQTPRTNRGATTIYMQTILDFAYDSEDLSLQDFDALVSFAEAHLPIVTYNTMRKVRMAALAAGSNASPSTPATPAVGPSDGAVVSTIGADAIGQAEANVPSL